MLSITITVRIFFKTLKTEIFLLILQFLQLLVSNGLEALAFFNWKLFENIVHRIQRGENQHLPNFFLFQKRNFLIQEKKLCDNHQSEKTNLI